MERLALGTKEYLVVRVRDRLNRIIDLASSNPTYDIREKGSASWVAQNSPADTEGLNALCLVDTDTWDVGTYELFLDFTNSPELPRLGPFSFDVA